MVNARVTSAFRPHRDTTSLRKRSASATSRSRTALAKRKPSVSGGKAARSPAKIARKVCGLTPSRSAIVTTNWVHGPQSSAMAAVIFAANHGAVQSGAAYNHESRSLRRFPPRSQGRPLPAI
jgi:hypothetical protein